MNPELENQISHAVNNEKMETSSKVTPICDEDQSENKMEVTESIAPQLPVQEEPGFEEAEVAAPAEEARPLDAVSECVTTPLEPLVSPCQEGTSCPTEPVAVERMQEETEHKENPKPSSALTDSEPTPAGQSCVEAELCPDGPVKLSSEAESLSASGDASKASTSSPPPPADLPSRDVLHACPPPLGASAGNVTPVTCISVTPKIGMGKPAITKRKFSPGRPRSKQVGRF